ncbi:MAG: ribosome biogenesis GTPase Der [Patescibacteria group bacterium]|nr:ribosome biogenesis GTPase Der [Patescibacteria group bacterium]MDD4304790.1 ribosome biogenesis GTPase Der [Patescibacteria group bacterium]MDD4695275.1 ribosome biogenesis GTPase Der [Patescibacteria group bacterium]
MESTKNKELPMISIIGRANVGKSTLFNLLVKKKALTSRVPGTTRDANYQETEWLGKKFIAIDTGGIEENMFEKEDKIQDEMDLKIIQKVKDAISKSQLVLFLVDSKTGIMPQDKQFANYLKKNKLKYLLVANKCGNNKERQQADEFYELGLGEPIKISAINGSGVGDLLDIVVKNVKAKRPTKKEKEEDIIKIIFIGKTNVGKSSIINSILQEERVIVSSDEHTTRDPQFIPFSYKDSKFLLIDTAGIRKNKSKIRKNELEFKSVKQTERSIKETDVVLLVTDSSKNLSVGDLKFAELVKENKKGLIIIANKWDLIEEKNLQTYNEYVKYYYQAMPFLQWAQILPVSAKEKIRTTKILDEAIRIYNESKRKFTDDELDWLRKKIIKIHPPTIGRGAIKPRLYKIKQVAISPLTFEIMIGAKSSLHESYLRFIEKKIREEYGLKGIQVVVYVKKLKNIT